ncbi:cellulose synthase/poly-beta-1,6-N-acetylglucosamine synthase-like glycosyltransferase [Flavobacterium sp. PL11]|jgi:cellulose synthase/poly-beta-1,6-N-acetylglucosamine synthase-like glycosyltransferase|uniref:glycosyltransferase n=1 Tax=Flavobacterium sp. PL11 TaxID=3071717 RepID=UPI002DF998B1|nr:cellulose synthase/poly-beta-1,6-N-acetylglucosamine synthase-like glycosyltransferase [Flavobacterium sp. PL11]
MIALKIVHILLLVYLGLSVLFLFIYAVLGQIPYKIKKATKNDLNKFVIFIPAYKEDAVIYNVAKRALVQDYPSEWFDVIVIADSLQQKTLNDLSLLPIQVNVVSFDKSTKAKALNKTMAELPDNVYDIALIMDADNILAPDFITKMNESFNAGYQVVQGHRAAKNINGFAMLDAISEEINNNIYSKGHRAIGLSSRLAGSGMAISYLLFKNTMKEIDSVAEDKEIELRLLKQGYKFEYRDDALCYDEKVSEAKVFNNQRSRWISAQYYYFKRDFLTAFWHLITKGNIDYFDKAFQMILPPRLILPGFLFITAIIAYFVSPDLYFYIWTGLFIANILSFIISIPSKFYSLKMMYALMHLPKAFFGIFITLFRMRGATKTFVHTPHSNDENENTN